MATPPCCKIAECRGDVGRLPGPVRRQPSSAGPATAADVAQQPAEPQAERGNKRWRWCSRRCQGRASWQFPRWNETRIAPRSAWPKRRRPRTCAGSASLNPVDHTPARSPSTVAPFEMGRLEERGLSRWWRSTRCSLRPCLVPVNAAYRAAAFRDHALGGVGRGKAFDIYGPAAETPTAPAIRWPPRCWLRGHGWLACRWPSQAVPLRPPSTCAAATQLACVSTTWQGHGESRAIRQPPAAEPSGAKVGAFGRCWSR